LTDRPFAYVCSPFRGDIEANTERAREYCRQVYEAGYTPLAPHLLFPQFLREEVPEEREAGLEMAVDLLPQCSVLVVCGNEISEGMRREVDLAGELGIEACALENIPAIPTAAELTHEPRDTGDPAHEKLGGIIRAYIANADKYTEGELVGVWCPFPAAKEDIQAAMEAIGVYKDGTDDYCVDDYETTIPGLYDRLPPDVNIDELNHLAVKIQEMDDYGLSVFGAVMESGRHCGCMEDIINVTENLHCFDLMSFHTPGEYGKFLIAFSGGDELAEIIGDLENSDDPGERGLAKYIGLLEKYVDAEAYGREALSRENGVITPSGCLLEGGEFREVYRDMKDIPADHRVFAFPEPERSAQTAGKPSVLDQIAAARAERAAAPANPSPEKPKSRGPEL